jgi:hypothetical protein
MVQTGLQVLVVGSSKNPAAQDEQVVLVVQLTQFVTKAMQLKVQDVPLLLIVVIELQVAHWQQEAQSTH